MINNSIRLYGEGGLVYLVPNSQFSDNNASSGYGLFGFEFFWDEKNANPISYFIELGGMGVTAWAEKLPGKPFYSNGFTTTAGFRFRL